MNIIQKLRFEICEAAKNCFEINPRDYNFSIESPKNPDNGDLSSNIAMILCKNLKKKPKDIAEKIVFYLQKKCDYAEIKIANPGFINIFLTPRQWLDALHSIQRSDFYEISNIGKGRKVNLEFASPNPTGPMHIGHARGAIYGQVLSNILTKCGYEITREYYINDAGNQIDLLALSVVERVKELCKMPFKIPEGGYPADYIIPIAKATLKSFSQEQILANENELSSEFCDFVVSEIMEIIKVDLCKLGVQHDIFISEKHEILEQNYIEKAISILKDKGLVYEGVLEAPKGKEMDSWEARDQLLFRSTDYGDDIDRPLSKPDGSHTYFAGDVGYHHHKLLRNYDILFLALGADHAGYVKRISACVEALAPKVEFKVLLFQLVKFMKNGKPYKMSKRAGNFIAVDDVLNEIDADSLKFLILSSKNDTTLSIDFTKAIEQSKDNPVFYVQYAHARCCSLLRKFEEIYGQDSTKHAELMLEEQTHIAYNFNQQEKDLIKLAHMHGSVIRSAAESFEPIKLINHLINLASKFHSLWNLEEYYFVDIELSNDAKIIKIQIVRSVLSAIKEIFALLGIKGYDRM